MWERNVVPAEVITSKNGVLHVTRDVLTLDRVDRLEERSESVRVARDEPLPDFRLVERHASHLAGQAPAVLTDVKEVTYLAVVDGPLGLDARLLVSCPIVTAEHFYLFVRFSFSEHGVDQEDGCQELFILRIDRFHAFLIEGGGFHFGYNGERFSFHCSLSMTIFLFN